ncbi:MAG: Rpn family recombination-promoting nuclease/putative transposase [Planctomycetota bacterium]
MGHHDNLTRSVFENPRHMRDLLRMVLPHKLVAALDLRTLELCPGSYVDRELKDLQSDLLFSVAARERGHALVYVLLEHKSWIDRWLPLQLLGYIVRIWERWRKAHPRERLLPPVLPVVLYHGRRRWRSPRSLSEIIDCAWVGSSIEFLPELRILLEDLNVRPDGELERAGTAAVRLALLLLKHASYSADFMQRLVEWARLLMEVRRLAGGGDLMGDELLRTVSSPCGGAAPK